MGHLVPAGTGFKSHRDIEIVKVPLPETKEEKKKGEKKAEEVGTKKGVKLKAQSAKSKRKI